MASSTDARQRRAHWASGNIPSEKSTYETNLAKRQDIKKRESEVLKERAEAKKEKQGARADRKTKRAARKSARKTKRAAFVKGLVSERTSARKKKLAESIQPPVTLLVPCRWNQLYTP